MPSVSNPGTPLPVGASIPPGSLRERLEALRAQGHSFPLSEAVHLIVPLCLQAAELHESGRHLFLNPSSLSLRGESLALDAERGQLPPSLPRDRACLAPEERGGQPGGARASVYALGAVLYEMVTGAVVGPAMARPTELVEGLPPELEQVLGRALVADPAHRPDDLRALAQAIHHLAPSATVPPPPADDFDAHLDVDVSLSMLPPPPALGFDLAIVDHRAAPVVSDSTSELASLKARLEADPRPRFVVVKDGMDHGPFSAVELLQQIASLQFVEADVLKDQFSQDVRAIKDWDEFAPFAEQARLHRDIKAEKVALEKTVTEERKSTRSKALIGVVVVGALLAAVVTVVLTKRGEKSDTVAVQEESVAAVDLKGQLNVPTATQKKGGGRGGVIGSSGGFPLLAGGMSCEAAQASYVEEMRIGEKGQADLTAGQYGAVLNRGSYFSHCGAPDDMSINICAAIQNGRAVGVTVTTNPKNPGVSGCIAAAVRGLSFPSNPKLDVTRTAF